jgi:predicted alpha/beta superfamily hydrolase
MCNKVGFGAIFGCLIFCLYTPFNLLAQPADTLFLYLDMSEPISEGWLDQDSEKVGIRGDQPPLSWATTFGAADVDKDGIYEMAVPFNLTTDSLLVSFKIKVDGVDNPDDGWQAGGNHEVTMCRGRENKVTLAWSDEPPEPKSTITGQVEIFRDFQSKNLVPRDLFIYLPPGYQDSDQRYPVLYMNDGQALFDASEIGQEWQVDEAAEELIRSGEIEPIIIVGIGNTQNRFDEYTPTRQIWRYELERVSEPDINSALSGDFKTSEGNVIRFRSTGDTLFTMVPGGGFWQPLVPESENKFYLAQGGITFTFEGSDEIGYDNLIASKPDMGGDGVLYGNFIINEVKPFIDENLKTKPEKEFTALGGSSLGGLITLYLGLNHPDVFSELLVVSPSVWWDGMMIIDEVKGLSESTHQHIWLDMGTREGEGAVESAEALHQALLKKGWSDSELRFLIEAGAAHNERAWAKRVPDMLRFLYAVN